MMRNNIGKNKTALDIQSIMGNKNIFTHHHALRDKTASFLSHCVDTVLV